MSEKHEKFKAWSLSYAKTRRLGKWRDSLNYLRIYSLGSASTLVVLRGFHTVSLIMLSVSLALIVPWAIIGSHARLAKRESDRLEGILLKHKDND